MLKSNTSATKRSSSAQRSGSGVTSIDLNTMNSSDQKVVITYTKIYVFYIESNNHPMFKMSDQKTGGDSLNIKDV